MRTIAIERTNDIDFIKGVLLHPSIWGEIIDDGCPPKDDFTPLIADGIYWLKIAENNIPCGVFFLHPHNYVCYEGHANILPEARGRAVEYALAGIAWMFKCTPCRRIITSVPENNFKALRFVEKVGFIRYGINEKSLLKNGELYDLIMLGVSKKE